jgi:hypothetical protein
MSAKTLVLTVGSIVRFHQSPKIDPGVKCPPYSEHTLKRKVMEKLL